MNVLTGAGVYLFISVLGIWMIKESRETHDVKI